MVLSNKNSNPKRSYFDDPKLYLKGNVGIFVRLAILKELLVAPEGKSILDIGCGDGSLSLPFLSDRNKITLLDLSSSMLEVARKKVPLYLEENVEFINQNLLVYKPAVPFDIVLCIGVIAHINSTAEAITKLSEITKPSGYCILQLTDASNFLAAIQHTYYNLINRVQKNYHYSLTKTNLDQIISIANINNFEVISSKKYFSNYPVMKYFPEKFSLKFLSKISKISTLVSFAPEVMLLLQKNDGYQKESI